MTNTPQIAGENEPRDGAIDFSSYSTPQLQELQYGINRKAFPKNFANLQTELNRREAERNTRASHARQFAIEFTAGDTWRDWLRAKLMHLPFYGAGSIAPGTTETRICGWQRTWLGVPQQAEVTLCSGSIRNVLRDGVWIEFESKRPWRYLQRFEFRVETVAEGANVVASLPTAKSKAFDPASSKPRAFDRHVRGAGGLVWLTPALVLGNVCLFVAMTVSAGNIANFNTLQLTQWGANLGFLTVNGQWWRLLSSLFLHLNAMHLLVNMWVLWSVGRLTERLFGSAVFLFIYVAAGTLASLASIAWNPLVVSVGASGAIFGVLGAFLAYLVRRRSEVPAAVIRSHWLATSLFLIVNLASGALQIGIDNAAHVGGLLGGFVLGFLLAQPVESAARNSFSRQQGLAVAAITAMVAAGAFGFFAWAQGQETVPERYFRANAWYSMEETRNLLLWQKLASDAAAGAVGSSDLEQRFDHDILPFWMRASRRIRNELSGLQGEQHTFVLLLFKLVELRVAWAQSIEVVAKTGESENILAATDLMQQTSLAGARVQYAELRSTMDHRARALAYNPAVVSIQEFFASLVWTCVKSPMQPKKSVVLADSRTDGPAIRAAVGCAAQRAFISGDYASLDATMNRYARSLGDLPDGSSRLTGLFDGLSDLFSYGGMDVQQALGRTADWRRAVSGSVEPDLVEVLYLSAWAYSARGTGYVNSVSPQSLQLFKDRMEMADAALGAAGTRGSSNPLWYALTLSVGRDRSLDPERLRAVFERGAAKFPHCLLLYRKMLSILMPRWLGTYADVDLFIVEKSARRGKGWDAETYAQLYWMYADMEGDETDIFRDAQADWPRMKFGLELMMQHYPQSDFVLNGFAKFACIAGDGQAYRSVRPLLMRRFSSTAWSPKVSVPVCDKKLKI